ncbi:hypothetical protein NEF87_004235 [Candidatus Lokiarchaeum ossiferum]|uniref:Glycoside hydrolase family 127 protein n=1 Tax=Candidatus Lokiarchaeum ossiferum TaxID=2951803 RepID=A0ABY6HWP1_9ARCH|nr:hypothetical protein NEF87_004235 [Candidatus Lokiarchaeum sp. B-35]
MIPQISSYQKNSELPYRNVELKKGFWKDRNRTNQEISIFYQWDQLEKAGSVDNFRIVGNLKKGFRKGFFYCDSDVHKWADAASIILASHYDGKLNDIIDEYIAIMEHAQLPDGYLYTYNQFHFPDRRWANIQIEHELYCLGHFIEAGISHFQATHSKKLLDIVSKSADLIVDSFQNCSPLMTPGHPEIEIALLKLYQITQNKKYLNMAQHFIEQRGKSHNFIFNLVKQNFDQNRRNKLIEIQKNELNFVEKQYHGFDFNEMAQKKEPFAMAFRSLVSFLSGKYFQQHKPLRKWKSPVGHSVRFGYFVTAATKLYLENGDSTLLSTLERLWDKMVSRRMYITGGVGSLPIIEGFGRDYELNNSYAYCETCAAIASIFWSWEMALATSEPKYHDLIERQLYNAASVGISLDGTKYLYRNILESEGHFERKPWFDTPCCPSNISRLWGHLGKYIYSSSNNSIWVNQYIESETRFKLNDSKEGKMQEVKIQMASQFPWGGKSNIQFRMASSHEFNLILRIPSWVEHFELKCNDSSIPYTLLNNPSSNSQIFPDRLLHNSYYINVLRTWQPDDVISINFPMKVQINYSNPKVRSNNHKIALSRGPLIYCLEDIDNLNEDMSNVKVDLNEPIQIEFNDSLLKGVTTLQARSNKSTPLNFVPYFTWLNRKKSKMQVWIRTNNS